MDFAHTLLFAIVAASIIHTSLFKKTGKDSSRMPAAWISLFCIFFLKYVDPLPLVVDFFSDPYKVFASRLILITCATISIIDCLSALLDFFFAQPATDHQEEEKEHNYSIGEE